MNNEKNEYLTTEEHGVLVRFLFSSSVKLRGKILLLALLICSCDLFNGPVQPDFLERIDEEIRWSNAAKLTVRVEYPGGWGTSSPSSGQIAPSPMDIRKGYAFELEFTPDIAYRFVEWRAYDTSVLNELGGDWRVNTTLLDGVPQLSGVDVPALSARGGKGEITIDTVTPVTLVPWCKTEPYVIRTEPRNEGRDSAVGMGYHPSTAVVAYFNTALDPEMTWGYGTGMVEIRARPITSIPSGTFEDWSERFEPPLYESRGGQYTVTMVPKASNMPTPGYQIEVTVGPSIRNVQGENMTSPEVFYYRVSDLEGVDAKITSWTATYNSGGTIAVSCVITGTDAPNAIATVSYQMNQGSSQSINVSRNVNSFTGTITGAGSVDASGIRDGRNAGGMREYHIFIELNAGGYRSDGADFKIWNFPGMKVDKNATLDNEKEAIEIRTVADLAAIHSTGLGRQYVLANDITVSNHSPINNFTGKFYGNGHTVTISSFAASASGNIGLFGVVGGGALIRDLTVDYSNVSFSHTNALNFGGIVGSTGEAVQLINVLTRGDVSISGNNNGSDIRVGGIVGTVDTGTAETEISINNAHSGLNLTVKNSGNVGSLNIGGIGGNIARPRRGSNSYTGEGDDTIRLENVTVAGNITVGEAANRVISNSVYIGGLIGNGERVRLANLDYKGEINAWCGNGTLYLGGAVGWVGYEAYNIYNCAAMQKNITINKTGSGDVYIGGFFGSFWGYAGSSFGGGTVKNCYSNGPVVVNAQGGTKAVGGFAGRLSGGISYCYTKGDVSVSSNGGVVEAGGFCGSQYRANSVSDGFTIQYCFAMGNVNATGSGTFNAGGFAGVIGRMVNDCYSTGNVFVDATSANDIMAGGLIGKVTHSDTNGSTPSRSFFHCFATGTVAAHRNANGTTSAAGLVGIFEPSTLWTTTIYDCAALGASVTATGPGVLTTRRVYGGASFAGLTLTRNRAYSGMGVYWSLTYKASSPNSATPAQAHNNGDGADIDFNAIRYIDFWKNSSPDSGPTLAIHGLGFSDEDWIFTTVGYYGYPTLRASKNGPAMAGQ